MLQWYNFLAIRIDPDLLYNAVYLNLIKPLIYMKNIHGKFVNKKAKMNENQAQLSFRRNCNVTCANLVLKKYGKIIVVSSNFVALNTKLNSIFVQNARYR
jgi:hypothetical protein